jgi:hypothetical protein
MWVMNAKIASITTLRWSVWGWNAFQNDFVQTKKARGIKGRLIDSCQYLPLFNTCSSFIAMLSTCNILWCWHFMMLSCCHFFMLFVMLFCFCITMVVLLSCCGHAAMSRCHVFMLLCGHAVMLSFWQVVMLLFFQFFML